MPTSSTFYQTGDVALVGTLPHSFLGVPLKASTGEVIGVLAVQSYDAGGTYASRECEMLEFASQQVALALQRRRDADRLRDSEQMLAGVFRRTPASITVSRSDGPYIMVNDAFTEITGYTREEATGRSALDLGIYAYPGDRERLLAYVGEGKADGFEVTFVAKDGHHVVGLVFASAVDIGGKRCLLTNVSDITARVRAERALRESEQRYRMLFDEMLNGFALHEVIFDSEGKTVDFRLLEGNPAFERLTGLPATAVEGRIRGDLRPGVEMEWARILGRVALTGRPFTQTTHHSAIGRYFDIPAFSAGQGRFAVVFADAAERGLPPGTETLLLAEDEPMVRAVAARVRRELGYLVLEAASAEEALRIARDRPGIDLLLTDVVMPQMSAIELATRVKGVQPAVKVLYTSGYTDNAIVHHGVLDDGVQFLPKPFTAAALAHKVRAVLDAALV